jgi:hypothetical protein
MKIDQRIINEMDVLFEEAKEDIYCLSMLLMAGALLKDNAYYKKNISAMMDLLDGIAFINAADSFKAWIYGRIVFAAGLMRDEVNAANACVRLRELLVSLKTADAYSCWAWGYLAGINHEEYMFAKNRMRRECEKLSADHAAHNSQAHLSNAIWGWIMCLLAASAARDDEMYDDAFSRILTLTHQQTVMDALSFGLLRSAASNDYPAWALAMVRLAAARHGDAQRCTELAQPVMTAITESLAAEARYEYILASLTNAVSCEPVLFT